MRRGRWVLAGFWAVGCAKAPETATAPVAATPASSVASSSPVSAPVTPGERARARFRARALVEAQRFEEGAAAFDALLAGPEARPEDAVGRLLAVLLGTPEGPVVVPAPARAFEGRSAAVAYLLGHAARRAGDAEGARAAFERAHAAAPDAPEARYWLAVTLAEAGRGAEALGHFDALAAAGASLGTLHALPAAFRAANLAPPAERATRLAAYERAFHERGQPAAPDELLFHGPLTALDLPPPPRDGAARAGPLRFTPGPVEALTPGPTSPALTLTWPAGIAGPPLLHVLTPAGLVPVPFEGRAAARGPLATPPKPLDVFAADADADGDADFGVAGPRPALVPGGAPPGPPVTVPGAAPAEGALAGDFDHDGDTDWLFVSRAHPPTVLRALGPGVGRLAVRHGPAPDAMGLGAARGLGAVMIYADDDPRVDVLVFGPALRLYRADRPGVFVDATTVSGLAGAGPVQGAAVVDLDADGRFDLVTTAAGATHWHRNLGGLRFGPAQPLTRGATALVEVDLDVDGFPDVLVVAPDRPPELCRGGGPAPVCTALAGVEPLTAAVAADFDLDGRPDVAGLARDGVRLFTQAPQADATALRLELTGHASNRGGLGAVVEVQTGGRYARVLARGGVLHLGLGGTAAADVLRVRWPTSALQSVVSPEAGALALREPADLMGSCPYLYAWDGTRFAFLGDVMGQAPIGIPVAPGVLVNADPTEPFLIPGERVAASDGRLRFVLKEEFREITYLDALRLEAVDRPETHVLCADGRCKAPPFPERELYASATTRPPRAARDLDGLDVLDRVTRLDDLAVGGRPGPGTQGVVAPHALELDLGPLRPDDRPILYLDGWVYWGGANTNAALFQDPARPADWPRVEVPDGRGGWRTVIADMGIPAGTTTRTIPVPLAGLVDPKDPRVRIVTALQAYWDRARVGLDGGEAVASLQRRPVPLERAELAFRGLSTRLRSGGDGTGPADWDYHRLTPPLEARWGQVAGGHTPYGDTRAALAAPDGAMVTLDAGDELTLEFDVRGLPAPAPGFHRDWLLSTVGWDKDTNQHTAGNESVGPLPYLGMPGHAHRGDAPPETQRRPRPPAPLVVDLRLRALDARGRPGPVVLP